MHLSLSTARKERLMIPLLPSRNVSLAPHLPYSHNSTSALHQVVNYHCLKDIITRTANKEIKVR